MDNTRETLFFIYPFSVITPKRECHSAFSLHKKSIATAVSQDYRHKKTHLRNGSGYAMPF